MKRAASISMPRPKGTTSRARLTITMHPKQLAELRARAESRSMSLTAYVVALLESDPDDVAPEKRTMFSLAELARCTHCDAPAGQQHTRDCAFVKLAGWGRDDTRGRVADRRDRDGGQ